MCYLNGKFIFHSQREKPNKSNQARRVPKQFTGRVLRFVHICSLHPTLQQPSRLAQSVERQTLKSLLGSEELSECRGFEPHVGSFLQSELLILSQFCAY